MWLTLIHQEAGMVTLISDKAGFTAKKLIS
jgi:hypothetical protein